MQFREDEILASASLGKNYLLMDDWVYLLFRKQKQYIPGGGKFDFIHHFKSNFDGRLISKVLIIFHPSIRHFISKANQAVFRKWHLDHEKGGRYGV